MRLISLPQQLVSEPAPKYALAHFRLACCTTSTPMAYAAVNGGKQSGTRRLLGMRPYRIRSVRNLTSRSSTRGSTRSGVLGRNDGRLLTIPERMRSSVANHMRLYLRFLSCPCPARQRTTPRSISCWRLSGAYDWDSTRESFWIFSLVGRHWIFTVTTSTNQKSNELVHLYSGNIPDEVPL